MLDGWQSKEWRLDWIHTNNTLPVPSSVARALEIHGIACVSKCSMFSDELETAPPPLQEVAAEERRDKRAEPVEYFKANQFYSSQLLLLLPGACEAAREVRLRNSEQPRARDTGERADAINVAAEHSRRAVWLP